MTSSYTTSSTASVKRVYACEPTMCDVCNQSLTSRHACQSSGTMECMILKFKFILDALVHSSKCRLSSCNENRLCRGMKDLFRHGSLCEQKASGGCSFCRTMWLLLGVHAKLCKQEICFVPRCREVKIHLQRKESTRDSISGSAASET
ncbi:hypothetical protein KP509_31G004700 [Ceratopteris richardii]|nr:hypothetical protein KP509_31G004700 [Ceratopteris richardii]